MIHRPLTVGDIWNKTEAEVVNSVLDSIVELQDASGSPYPLKAVLLEELNPIVTAIITGASPNGRNGWGR